uniref:Immunoglobulin V-set domain-containing protein n=1 Tax=Poecilia mexicana TaxID=48701 RepID=A0A3B3WXT3_9TELE
MELHLLVTVCLLFGKIMTTHQTHSINVRVDCEFLASDMVPGPYCEYRQDSRLVGSTYPNAVIYVSTEDRRRSNVSLVAPNLCRLTWAPLADEKPYTYTCRVYQGNGWKENSMAKRTNKPCTIWVTVYPVMLDQSATHLFYLFIFLHSLLP